jgi:hypothetical protein
MRWVLSIFRLRCAPPPLREIPVLLLKCTAWGMISGPFFALVFAMMTNGPVAAFPLLAPMPLLLSMINGAVWALSFYIACGLGNSYLQRVIGGYPRAIGRPLAVIYNIAASSLAFVAAVTLTSQIPGFKFEVPAPVFWRIVVIDGMIGGVLALVISAFVKLKMEVVRVQAQLRHNEVETARAQGRALQSQINPHFFFNTLNTISALVDDNPSDAKRMIGRLADMFRYTLGGTHTESVGIGQELQFVRDYLLIEQSRFRKRLRVELPEGPLPDIRVPGLVLQPLVENAVKHGIARRIEGGTVSVTIEKEGTVTRVSVRNSADEHGLIETASLYRAGHALENVRARLRIFTGVEDPLRLAQNSHWTEFSFKI